MVETKGCKSPKERRDRNKAQRVNLAENSSKQAQEEAKVGQAQ